MGDSVEPKATTNRITLLSVMIPVYNEQNCLPALYGRLSEVLDKMPFETEILFVNDGSNDSTLNVIRGLQIADPRIAYVDLSRNYGKEIAISAGIDYIRGDALVILDADLQDPPELMLEMYPLIEQGWDDVYARRRTRRGDSFMKKATAKIYYSLLKKVSEVPVQENTGDFRMFGKKAIEALRSLKERERNMKVLFSYVGFRKKALEYDRDPRIAGKSKWSYPKLTGLAVKGLTSSSKLPLRIVSVLGLFVSLIAFIYMIVVFVKALIWGDPVSGYPSLMSVILFMGGVQLLALGIIGEYLGIIFNETKRRPLYYVNEYSRDGKE